MRTAVGGTAVVLVALLLGACGGSGRALNASARPDRAGALGAGTYTVGSAATPTTAQITTTGASAPATATQATATTAVRIAAHSAQLRRLQAVLVGADASLGSHVGVAVEDLDTGQMLFGQNLGLAQPPASLEKLYTSTALLSKLGADAVLDTDLFGIGYLRAGVWHGDLYLRGDGDPTFGDGGWNAVFDNGYGPTAAQLITQLRADGIRSVHGLLYADASRFDSDEGGPATGDAPDIPDYGGELSALVYDHGFTTGKLGPAQTTVHELALYARATGLHLVASTQLAVTPPGATRLAQLVSPPFSVMLRLMLVPSDDLFADLFAKQLGFRFGGGGTLSQGAAVIRRVIANRYGITPTILDGSGLDKSDRSTPTDFLTLLKALNGTSDGAVIRADLPVMARTGTVEGIGVHTPAAGRCQAKTGTLDNVTNLAGYCETRDGQTLAFVFMADGPPNGVADATFTPMVGAVAGY